MRLLIRRLFVPILLFVGGLFLVGLSAPAELQAQSASFRDTPADAWYYNEVEDLRQRGVFENTECQAYHFCPDQLLLRWQMAVWVVRTLHEDLLPTNLDYFADVDAHEWWLPYPERLADLEITLGCRSESPAFCPNGVVNRAQMAVFLSRAFDLPVGEPAGFADISDHHWAADHINALAASGITLGCDDTNFCPAKTVSRAQMAVFLSRALAWSTPEPEPWSPVGPLGGGNRYRQQFCQPDTFCTEDNRLSRFTKEQVIDLYGSRYPWLLDAWNIANRPDFEFIIMEEGVGRAGIEILKPSETGDTLRVSLGEMIRIGRGYVNAATLQTHIHELAHIYSMSHAAPAEPAALAALWLYFSDLTAGQCSVRELLAETFELLFADVAYISSVYWRNCDILPSEPTGEAVAAVEAAVAGRLPDWFVSTFQQNDGSWDLEQLWLAVKYSHGKATGMSIGLLRDAFGGYCSSEVEEEIHEHLFGDHHHKSPAPGPAPSWNQPWRDGGCQ